MRVAAEQIGLRGGELDACFPFHLVLDETLQTRGVGTVLARLLPELLDGGPLLEHFEPLRMGSKISFDTLAQLPRACVMLRSKRLPLLVLRGQIVPTTEGRLLFVGGPRVSLEGLKSLGLALDDFATHDPMGDFLFLVHGQQASLAESTRVSGELARFNAELESRVLARTAELESANERLHREKRERERMEGEVRISHRLEAVGQLAAGIAHEINTPIQYVGDSIHFLKSSLDDLLPLIGTVRDVAGALHEAGRHDEALALESSWQEMDGDFVQAEIPRAIARMFDGIDRVAGIVRAMKSLAHPGSEERAPANLNDALANTLIVARNEFKYVADIETELGALPPVVCHLGEINQVFLNLVVNAAHAVSDAVGSSGRRGAITVRSLVDGDDVIVEVEDTGIGIRPELKDRIFDPFFTTKPVGKGTGQGLAMARAIAVKHGGALSYESTVGRGTTFTLRLPIGAATASRASAA